MEVYNKYDEIWSNALTKLKEEINDNAVLSSFFYGTKIVSISDNTITVSAPSSFAVSILNNRYLELIRDVLNNITQSNYDCEIIDSNSLKEEIEITRAAPAPSVFISNLNPKFTFETFVVGPSNHESYVAATATATDPGNFYNPLFIYGRSGLGKTHLLHAIGNYIRVKNPAMKVLYRSTDDFVEEVVKAFKDTGIENLKDKYREVDVLLLDDVQFLSTKEKTKETLFHIFNLLINSGKQIVLTSDRHPSEIKSLEDRLVGRFSSGLSIEIKALEYDTAYRILKKKVESQDINNGKIDDNVLQYLAKNYATDVRKLEGALNKLLFYAITFNPGSEINMDVVTNTFAPLVRNQENNNIDINLIKTAVSEYYSISPSQLSSKLRTSNITVARHIAMYLCRSMLDVSLVKIGEEFGGRDHSTVINACEKVEKMLKENPDYIQAIEDLKRIIKTR